MWPNRSDSCQKNYKLPVSTETSSASLAVKEIQAERTGGFHLALFRTVVTNDTTKAGQGVQRTEREPVFTAGGDVD